MPISARWREIARLPPARGRDAMPGVYELADADKQVIYIGQSARDVPNRLRQHLARRGCIASRACYWRYAYSRVPQAEEADLLSRHRDLTGDLPECNLAHAKRRDGRLRYLERSSEK